MGRRIAIFPFLLRTFDYNFRHVDTIIEYFSTLENGLKEWLFWLAVCLYSDHRGAIPLLPMRYKNQIETCRCQFWVHGYTSHYSHVVGDPDREPLLWCETVAGLVYCLMRMLTIIIGVLALI
jgi:hypothetical protein